MAVIFEFQRLTFATTCDSCVKEINDQCCRTNTTKICCDNEYRALAKRIAGYPNCPTESSISRKIKTKGLLHYID